MKLLIAALALSALATPSLASPETVKGYAIPANLAELNPKPDQMPPASFFARLPAIGTTVYGRGYIRQEDYWLTDAAGDRVLKSSCSVSGYPKMYNGRCPTPNEPYELLPKHKQKRSTTGLAFPTCEAFLERGGDTTFTVQRKSKLVQIGHKKGQTGWVAEAKAAVSDNVPGPASEIIKHELEEDKPLLRTVVGYAYHWLDDGISGGKVAKLDCLLIDSRLPMADGSYYRKAPEMVAAGAGVTCSWAAKADPEMAEAAKRFDVQFNQSTAKRWLKLLDKDVSAVGDGPTSAGICGTNNWGDHSYRAFSNPAKAPVAPVCTGCVIGMDAVKQDLKQADPNAGVSALDLLK